MGIDDHNDLRHRVGHQEFFGVRGVFRLLKGAFVGVLSAGKRSFDEHNLRIVSPFHQLYIYYVLTDSSLLAYVRYR